MRGWKERLAAAHDYRVNEEAVLVDEVELDAVSREPGTADLEVAVHLFVETADLLGTLSRASLAFPSTLLIGSATEHYAPRLGDDSPASADGGGSSNSS